MKSGKLQKFNAATITISDNVTRHNEACIAMELQWMKQFTVVDRRAIQFLNTSWKTILRRRNFYFDFSFFKSKIISNVFKLILLIFNITIIATFKNMKYNILCDLNLF